MRYLILFAVLVVALVACAPATPGGEPAAGEGVTTESGLQFIELEEGDGPSPQPGDVVVVHYTGTLEDGTQFDSSLDRGQPFPFTLGQGQVIPGWDEGIALMNVGDKARLVIPPELAYGAQGVPGTIPPDSTLIFEVELLEIQDAPTPAPVPTALPTPTPAADEQTTESGLRYIILEEGDGPSPEPGDVVQVHYTGTLADGTQFDSSRDRGEPFAFPLGQGRVIAGWDEGIDLLNVGDRALLIIPPELGYGPQGSGGTIPPNATLIFDVEVLEILPGAPSEPTSVEEGDYTTTESGLQYYDIEEGEGDMPEAGETVQVHFTGWVQDGAQFGSTLDTGQPFPLTIGSGQPFPGLDEGVSTMRFGGVRQLVIPAELAFGEQGGGNVIPPGATVVLEVELLEESAVEE